MTKIYLAGGCFWGVEAYFQSILGVTKTKVGYIDGLKENPTYEEVCSGKFKHAEAVMLEFDESIITYENILNHFFYIIDPFSTNKQGNDIGIQYRSGIYIDNSLYDKTIIYLQNKFKSNYQDLKTEVKLNKTFYLAEEYHQNYLIKNPQGYCHINLADKYEGD